MLGLAKEIVKRVQKRRERGEEKDLLEMLEEEIENLKEMEV